MKKWLALLLAAAMALSVTLAGFAESDESDGGGSEKSSAESSAKSESKPKAESSASKSGESKSSESKASESNASESKSSEAKSSESKSSESKSSESNASESKSSESKSSESNTSENKAPESQAPESGAKSASDNSAKSSSESGASTESASNAPSEDAQKSGSDGASTDKPADGGSESAGSGESAPASSDSAGGDAASDAASGGESAPTDTSDISDGEAPSEVGGAEGSGIAVDAAGEASAPKEEAEEADDSGLTAAQIRSVQSWLIQLDYLAAGHVTGVYDDATRSAVKRFQADNGLSATGECSAATYSAIARKAAAASGGTASDGAETSPEDAVEGIGDEAFNSEGIGGEIDGTFADEAALAPARDYGNADDADEIDATGSLSEAQSQKVQAWLTELGYLTDDGEVTELTDEAIAEAIAAAVAQFQAENGLEVTDACDSATYRLIYEKFLELASSEEGEGGGPGGPGGGPGGFPGGAHGSGGRGHSGRSYRGGVGGMGGAGLGGEPEEDPLNGITPGEALTSTHRSGDKSDTLYGALASLEEAGLDIALSTGPSEAELSPAGIEGATAGDGRLRLYGGDSAVQRWTLNGMTLRALARSGIDALTLAGDGGSVTLKTSGLLTGSVYSALRARGQTDNTFEYTVTLSGGAASVTAEAGGAVYATVIRDGALALVKPDGGEA